MQEFALQQKQKAQLSFQQILGSQLLQLPLANLEQRINEELQENPLLEAVEGVRDRVEDGGGDDTASSDEMFDEIDRFSKSSLKESASGESGEARLSFTRDSGQKERFFQAVQHDSFHETLLKQLALLEGVGAREGAIALEILGNLDGDDYFKEEPGVLSVSLGEAGLEVGEEDIEAVRRQILYLDPPGVAALDLRERLMVQLRASRKSCPQEVFDTAMAMLESHYDDFLQNRFERIIKRLGRSKGVVEAAVQAITGLDPHPGIFQDEGGHYIAPDFEVLYENGELSASLNDRSALSVKVSEAYGGVLSNRKGDREEKRFIRKNLQRAQEFQSALQQRRQTLLKVIESLMKHQYAFFTQGPEHLVPLGMKVIAADTGLDISTISRAVNGKYVQTRFGLFELKYFFSAAIQTDEGEDLSNKIVKQQLAELISREDPAKPLSDDRLAELLAENGMQIARRTVAKYREQLHIPVARLRKKIF